MSKQKLEFEVCVYGTLKKGYGNHRIITEEGGTYLRNHKIQGFVMFDLGGFPCIVPSTHDSAYVHVEMYAINRKALERMDQLEGHPNFYQRMIIETEHGRHFVYVYTPSSFRSMCLFRKPLRWVMDGEWLRPSNPELIYDITTFEDLDTIVSPSFLKNVDLSTPLQQRIVPRPSQLPVVRGPLSQLNTSTIKKEEVYRVTRNVEA